MPQQLHDIKARLGRLDELAKGLAEAVQLPKVGGDAGFLGWERGVYSRAVQDALAGADEARNVLAGVLRRMEGA